MATADRYAEKIVCQCGNAVTVHWIDRAYLTSEPEIERVVGSAIKARRKSGRGITNGCIDVLCGRCGAMLYESAVARFDAMLLGESKDAPVLKDARDHRVAQQPKGFLHGR